MKQDVKQRSPPDAAASQTQSHAEVDSDLPPLWFSPGFQGLDFTAVFL